MPSASRELGPCPVLARLPCVVLMFMYATGCDTKTLLPWQCDAPVWHLKFETKLTNTTALIVFTRFLASVPVCHSSSVLRLGQLMGRSEAKVA